MDSLILVVAGFGFIVFILFVMYLQVSNKDEKRPDQPKKISDPLDKLDGYNQPADKPTPEIKDKEKPFDPSFYTKQIAIVSKGGFGIKRLLNETEQHARKGIYASIYSNGQGDNVFLFAQVSLGELLKNEANESFLAITCKRVDFVITDRKFIPIAVVEINGSGHYESKNAVERDKVKRIAIEDAGILYIAIEVDTNHNKTKTIVEHVVSEKLFANRKAA